MTYLRLDPDPLHEPEEPTLTVRETAKLWVNGKRVTWWRKFWLRVAFVEPLLRLRVAIHVLRGRPAMFRVPYGQIHIPAGSRNVLIEHVFVVGPR